MMSALGQKRTFASQKAKSYVCFTPNSDGEKWIPTSASGPLGSVREPSGSVLSPLVMLPVTVRVGQCCCPALRGD